MKHSLEWDLELYEELYEDVKEKLEQIKSLPYDEQDRFEKGFTMAQVNLLELVIVRTKSALRGVKEYENILHNFQRTDSTVLEEA